MKQPNFRYKQKVKIIKGFYQGKISLVVDTAKLPFQKRMYWLRIAPYVNTWIREDYLEKVK